MKRRVVVTGIGTINPIGNDAPTSWKNAKNGVNGIALITRYDASQDDVKVAGEIKGFDFEEYFGKKNLKRMDRFVQLGLIASNEAITDSGIDFTAYDEDRVGVYYASGIGGLETISEQKEKAMERGYGRMSPYFIPSTIINIAAGNIAIEHKIKGPVLSTVTACASSTNSIGEAFHAIRDGYLDVCVTGGSEATVIPFAVWGFSVMQALNKGDDPNYASIPFDVNRSGFVLGEGAATLILEDLESAKKRNAKIYAEVIGYGATCDATHITSPDPEGDGARRCMLLALADGNLKPEDVDYINAHGTSTPLNDKTETLAIKRAFGDHAYKLSVSSSKSMTGHMLGATGGVEAIFSLLSVKEDFITPTINVKELDPLCDLNYTLHQGVKKTVNVAISNSLGFGGHNATIAFQKYKGD
ncbi:MAG: beta-ketoacyl-ACP synthase II [Bacilli bacterium]|nr:beta-ketoacyl-ACP synthase II [Bacilli bacterium]MBN2877241.1 beta-ketoacyl-ACP synthase II [Bacilli bacterium]